MPSKKIAFRCYHAECANDPPTELVNEAPVQAITRIEDAAKQLVTLTGLLQGLYFAVFAFSGLHDRITNRWLLLFATLPVGLWLVSLCCATLVFVPRVRQG